MKYFRYPIGFLLAVVSATSQIRPSADDFFPSNSEFIELRSISSSENFSDPAQLSRINNGKLISDVGFQKYARRIYSLAGSKSLSIEVITLLDMQAAYSLLILAGNSSLQPGPPGDEYVADAKGIRFFHGNKWVDIKSSGASEDLVKQVALFVSDRIGSRRQKRPALISHLPKSGYSASTLRYFPGFRSFKTYTKKLPVWIGSCGQDMEIAQANYSAGNQIGRLSLLSFPTQELAEECYSKLASPASPGRNPEIYVKTSGPLVGILESPMDAGSAKKILDSIQSNYSVNWIYDNKTKPKSVWGIPYSILGTVVQSFFFVALLAVLSMGAGIAFGFIRYRLRSLMSNEALENENTHLRMR